MKKETDVGLIDALTKAIDSEKRKIAESECREFWKQCFVVMLQDKDCLLHKASEIADDCLVEFKRRWEVSDDH